MNKNITTNIKKNIFIIASIILCGFVLSICSANSGLDLNKTTNTTEKTQIENSSSDNSYLKDIPEFNGTELFYKTLLAVILVIIMGIAALFLTKKVLPKFANISGKEIKIIETVNLGPRKSLHLLEIGKRRFLIGSTYENINKLAELTDFSHEMPIPENEL